MKKRILLTLLVIALLTGCSNSNQAELKNEIEQLKTENQSLKNELEQYKLREEAFNDKEQIEADKISDDKEASIDSNNDELPHVKVEDLALDATMDKELNSADVAYITMEYKNDSKYPIVAFNLKANLKDSNETEYYSTYDTVMPGETSPKFKGFAPKTLKKEDVEFLTIDYNYIKDKKEYSVEYDSKLGVYEVMEYTD